MEVDLSTVGALTLAKQSRLEQGTGVRCTLTHTHILVFTVLPFKCLFTLSTFLACLSKNAGPGEVRPTAEICEVGGG